MTYHRSWLLKDLKIFIYDLTISIGIRKFITNNLFGSLDPFVVPFCSLEICELVLRMKY